MKRILIPEALRKDVASRANFRCEYCLSFAKYSFLSFHVEHIISIKHGGSSEHDNLAYSCPICNLNKGSDIATVLDDIQKPVRFYNPRRDEWSEHFEVEPNGIFLAKSEIGQATIKMLDLNHPDSIMERMILLENGLF